MVLSLVVPFQGCQVLARGVCDEVVVGSAPVGYRASEAPRRLQQAAISTTQVRGVPVEDTSSRWQRSMGTGQSCRGSLRRAGDT
jgi:hypothetical protein